VYKLRVKKKNGSVNWFSNCRWVFTLTEQICIYKIKDPSVDICYIPVSEVEEISEIWQNKNIID
jgi:hypothetical protein